MGERLRFDASPTLSSHHASGKRVSLVGDCNDLDTGSADYPEWKSKNMDLEFTDHSTHKRPIIGIKFLSSPCSIIYVCLSVDLIMTFTRDLSHS